MNTRRGSTLSPIRPSKIVLASATSFTFTCNSERAPPGLVRVHLARALVALQRDALAAGGGHRLEQADRAMDGRLLVLAPQQALLGIDRLQRNRVFIELARIGGAEQRLIEDRDL